MWGEGTRLQWRSEAGGPPALRGAKEAGWGHPAYITWSGGDAVAEGFAAGDAAADPLAGGVEEGHEDEDEEEDGGELFPLVILLIAR